ncbi:fibronectin type III domain-containing protein [Leptolyngbya sp. FACHB-261]|uniref:fibronectin type III domain-containing protein n=1 Tax=Leptolyngbya sp. FACHB-261 TaxID=2692806 RepID=UPI001687D709|nr:fibronectin type III domain-containing protein [Leptolyngbya sp. FACHB-261]MBD2101810.1 fibronectin type III domain-containing protein [Leptolyngbya sp. FACHB-261]
MQLFHPWTRRAILVAVLLTVVCLSAMTQAQNAPGPQLLSDPFLQLPNTNSVRVVWFTEFAGSTHNVAYGPKLEQTAKATTRQLSRSREDQNSKVGEQNQSDQVYSQPVERPVWRHEAEVTGLNSGVRLPYRVTSVREDGQAVSSEVFSLSAQPKPSTPLKILLTSDHQLMPLVPANLQKVVETVGQVDAVFLAGDLVNVPDRASEWFDDNRGNAFFANLQGRAQYELTRDGVKTLYRGGALIQHAPLFTAIGNHEVMGRFSTEKSLNLQFYDAFPRQIAAKIYPAAPQEPQAYQRWLKDHSFNTDSYEELFSLPQSETGNQRYYAVSFGDVRLVVLYATTIWRTPDLHANYAGRYQERPQDVQQPQRWGYGHLIFEPIAKGSTQYNWLAQELNSPEFQQAKYRLVMFHHPPHSLGDNVVPPYTDPVQQIEREANGSIKAIRYEYPRQADYLIRDVVPLLESAGAQLVLYGHTHIWNRFVSPAGLNFLESSNVGNSYGAYVGARKRPVPPGDSPNYVATGDPNGLEPVVPTLAPLLDDEGQPLPYLSSNDITAFSILDTSTGTVSSYRFDTRKPDSEVVKFDEFKLSSSAQ